jgi:hypothetical protein
MVLQPSCGLIGLFNPVHLEDDLGAMERGYYQDINDEVAGKISPQINISWNTHWTRIIAYLKETDSNINKELIRYIIVERRNRGLPELRPRANR